MLCLQRQAWRHFVGYEKARGHLCWEFGFSLGFFWTMNMTRNTPWGQGCSQHLGYIRKRIATKIRECDHSNPFDTCQATPGIHCPVLCPALIPQLQRGNEKWKRCSRETPRLSDFGRAWHVKGGQKNFCSSKSREGPGKKPIPNFQWLKGSYGSDGGQEARDFRRFRGNIGLE